MACGHVLTSLHKGCVRQAVVLGFRAPPVVVRPSSGLRWLSSSTRGSGAIGKEQKEDPFAVLGLPRSATEEQLRERFRAVARTLLSVEDDEKLRRTEDAFQAAMKIVRDTATSAAGSGAGGSPSSSSAAAEEDESAFTGGSRKAASMFEGMVPVKASGFGALPRPKRPTPLDTPQAPYKDTVATQRRWPHYQQVRQSFISAWEKVPAELRERWDCAIRRFHLARVVSWQVACALAGQSGYLLCSDPDTAVRLRREEGLLWEQWEAEALDILDWCTAHPGELQGPDHPQYRQREAEYVANFEGDRAKAVVAMAFDDWKGEFLCGTQPLAGTQGGPMPPGPQPMMKPKRLRKAEDPEILPE
eukprot:RCo043218